MSENDEKHLFDEYEVKVDDGIFQYTERVFEPVELTPEAIQAAHQAHNKAKRKWVETREARAQTIASAREILEKAGHTLRTEALVKLFDLKVIAREKWGRNPPPSTFQAKIDEAEAAEEAARRRVNEDSVMFVGNAIMILEKDHLTVEDAFQVGYNLARGEALLRSAVAKKGKKFTEGGRNKKPQRAKKLVLFKKAVREAYHEWLQEVDEGPAPPFREFIDWLDSCPQKDLSKNGYEHG